MQSYGYDNLNRLSSAAETSNGQSSWQQTFTYDQWGNRQVVTAQNATTAGMIGDNPSTSTANNRIVAQSGELYQYDAAGNLITDRVGNSYSFDGENTQAAFSYAGTSPVAAQYFYDGEGRRVKKIAGNDTTVFVYNALGQLVAEYESNPQPANGTTYLSADNLGTPRVTTDSSGSVQTRHDYLPFGEEIGAYGGRANHAEYRADSVRQKYTGLQRDDENGLDYAQARYYASTAGRFTSVDPLMASASTVSPQTFNRYTYALNNPYKYVDPSGMASEETDQALAALNALDEWADEVRAAEEAERDAQQKQRQQRQTRQPQRSVSLAERGNDVNAFQQRANDSVDSPSDVRQFSTGDEIVSGLQDLSASGSEISRVTVHSHGYGAGVIGVEDGTGLYIDWEGHPERINAAGRGVLSATNAGLKPEAATTADLVGAITGDNPSIRIAKGGSIAFLGCNSTALASHLSYELAQANRGDIQVIGATNKVYPKNGEPRVDHGGTFQTYQAGRMISETKRMKYK